MRASINNSPQDALTGATPFLRLFSLARGGASLANLALAAGSEEKDGHHIAIARFFAENLCPGAGGYEAIVTEGAASVAMGRGVFEEV